MERGYLTYHGRLLSRAMIIFGLLLVAASNEMVLHCRSEQADPAASLATGPFTLVESEKKVKYPVPTGTREVGAIFKGGEIAFPDNWPDTFKGGYVINRRSLNYRRLVTYNEKIIIDERGSCSIFVPPPEAPDWMRGARPPQN